MRRTSALCASLVGLLLVALYPAMGLAQDRVEGTVTSTRVTLCEFKPGGCEGDLVLERKGAGQPEQMKIKVPKGTLIKKGEEVVYLPSLRGNVVAVAYVREKGEAVAKSIEVLKRP